MEILCQYLLRLYPAAHRREFGEEMREVLRERQAEARSKRLLERCSRSVREAGGLLHGAAEEHWRWMMGSGSWGAIPMRRMGMRSEFRFPKATAVLMTVILLAIIFTIEKARAIQLSVPETHQQVGPIQSGSLTVLPTFGLLLVLGCAAGAIAWAIAFAMKRSGVQRIEELSLTGSKGGARS